MELYFGWLNWQNLVFENFYIQAGMDQTGVPTDMLTLNSTIKIFFRNPATFFGVHVSSTPLELHYYQLKLASGHVSSFPILSIFMQISFFFFFLPHTNSFSILEYFTHTHVVDTQKVWFFVLTFIPSLMIVLGS